MPGREARRCPEFLKKILSVREYKAKRHVVAPRPVIHW